MDHSRLRQEIIDWILHSIFWKSPELVYLGCNQHFAELAGFKSPRDVVGKTDFELSRREEAAAFREIDRAVMVQQQLLPAEPLPCGFLRVDIFHKPLERITGDFYSFRRRPGKGYNFLGADIVGHGISAALFTSLLEVTCQRAPDGMRGRPADFLCFLDRELSGAIPCGMFTAAAFSFVSDEKGGIRFSHSCAAHPPPVLFEARPRWTNLRSFLPITSWGTIRPRETIGS